VGGIQLGYPVEAVDQQILGVHLIPAEQRHRALALHQRLDPLVERLGGVAHRFAEAIEGAAPQQERRAAAHTQTQQLATLQAGWL
jgi:hypothetical protein